MADLFEAQVTSVRTLRSKDPLPLGPSLSEFMRQLDLVVAGGQNGPINRLRDQIRRLMNARISVHYLEDNDEYSQEAAQFLQVASRYELWPSLWQAQRDFPAPEGILRVPSGAW